MPIIFRWIFQAGLVRLCITMLLLLSIFLIVEIFDKSRHLGHGMDMRLLIHYLLLKMPFMVSDFMSVVVLIANSLLLLELNRHHEIIALRAAGLGINKVIVPMLAVSLLAGLTAFAIGEFVTPASNARLADIERTYIQHRAESTSKGPKWVRENNRFLHLNPLGENIFSILVIETDTQGRWRRRIDASRGRYEGDHWDLRDVYISLPSDGSGMRLLHQPRMILPSAVDPGEILLPSPAEMNFAALYHYVLELEKAGLNAQRYAYALHQKFAAPIACLFMALLAAALCIQPGTRSSAASWGLVGAIALGLAYYVTGDASSLLARGGLLPPAFAAWLPNILFGGMAAFILLHKEGH